MPVGVYDHSKLKTLFKKGHVSFVRPKTYIKRICNFCNESFETENQPCNKQRFCSVACARSYTGKIVGNMRKGKKWEEFYSDPKKAKLKMIKNKGNKPSEKYNCVICKKEFFVTGKRKKTAKYCSYKCYWIDEGKNLKYAQKRAEIFKKIKKERPSIPQIFLCNYLKKKYCERNFVLEHSFLIPRKYFPLKYCKNKKEFWLDIADLNRKIDFEVDGKMWHGSEEHKKIDAERDKILEEEGWTVVRIPAKEVTGITSKNLV